MTISTIATLITSHVEIELESIGCGLDVDRVYDVLSLDLDSLIAVMFGLEESWLEVMKQLIEVVPLLGGLLAEVLIKDGLVGLLVRGQQVQRELFLSSVSFQH